MDKRIIGLLGTLSGSMIIGGVIAALLTIILDHFSTTIIEDQKRNGTAFIDRKCSEALICSYAIWVIIAAGIVGLVVEIIHIWKDDDDDEYMPSHQPMLGFEPYVMPPPYCNCEAHMMPRDYGQPEPYMMPQNYAQPGHYMMPQVYGQPLPNMMPQAYARPGHYTMPQAYARPATNMMPQAFGQQGNYTMPQAYGLPMAHAVWRL